MEEEEEVEVIIEHWKLTELSVESRKRKGDLTEEEEHDSSWNKKRQNSKIGMGEQNIIYLISVSDYRFWEE